MAFTNAFNLDRAKAGKAIRTKLGNKAQFITVTRDGKLLVLVHHRSKIGGTTCKYVAHVFENTPEKYELDGRKYKGTNSAFDLEMVESYLVGLTRDSKGRFVKVKK